jgi:hypothetical protein
MADSSVLNKLEHIVSIYGYSYEPFTWNVGEKKTLEKKPDKKTESCFQTTGLFVGCGDKKYILSSRKPLIGYRQHMVVYRCGRSIWTSKLRMLYQMIEYNVIVFGTHPGSEQEHDSALARTDGMTCFDHAKSNVITSDLISDSSGLENQPISLYEFPLKPPILKPPKKYQIVRNEHQIDTQFNFQVHLYPVTYIESKPNDQTYVPFNYVHLFKIKCEEEIRDLIGSFIITKKRYIIGVVSEVKGDVIYVDPMRYLENGFKIWSKYGPNEKISHGAISDIFGNDPHLELCTRATRVSTQTTTKLIKKDDVLLEINGLKISIDQANLVIYDVNLNQLIPLSIYCKLYPLCLSPMNVVLKRGQNNIFITVTSIPDLKESDIQLSLMDHFYPTHLIPYINLNGLILTQLSHELIDILYSFYPTLKNELIEKVINDQPLDGISEVVVIDCVNVDLMDSSIFPLLSQKKRKTLEIPIVTKINGTQVQTLTDVVNLLSKGPVVSIHCGSSLEKQQKILIEKL